LPILLAGVTLAGSISPVLLLILTFALSAGDAFESPAWRAMLPELVSQEDLPAAAALNGIEFFPLAGQDTLACGRQQGAFP
jgi:hypothetical protein